MLQTWRLNSKGKTHQHPQQVFDLSTGKPAVQQACNNCRVKKLKCSGKRTGCHRCQNLNQTCTYDQNGKKRRNRKDPKPRVGDKSRRSSVSASETLASACHEPTSVAEVIPTSPLHVKFSPSLLQTSHFALPSAPDQSGNNPDDTTSLNASLIQYEPMEYHSLQIIPAMSLSNLISDQNDDIQPPTWSEPPQETYPEPTIVPQGGVDISSPLSSSADGWEMGIQSPNEAILATPVVSNLALKPIISDIQPIRLPPCPQIIAGQDSFDYNDLLYQTPEPCHCFRSIVFVFEEINSGAIETSAKDFGSWLSKYKEALRCCEAMLMCSLCRIRREYMGILILLADRLVTMCDEVVSTYLSIWAGNISCSINGPQASSQLVCVGSLEIDSPIEWHTLVSTMLAMQLRRLSDVMVQSKSLLWCIEGELARRKADTIQNRILVLLDKINSPQADHNGMVVPPSGPRIDSNLYGRI
ncbi:hypothetical protein F5Y14DRAFT_109693 [Nemania sp. NC0429]|nr:hypothetical protein F5Y14DRAFT_109693 [Nemania sp. NC0429]